MKTTIREPVIEPVELEFRCVHCGTTLLVPRELAGIEGPCPRCRRATRAPREPAVEPSPTATRRGAAGVAALGLPRPKAHSSHRTTGRLGLDPEAIESFVDPLAVSDRRKGFVARRCVEKTWQPDDGWREALRERRRRSIRQRQERLVVSAFESRAFRVARVVLSVAAILILAGTLAFMHSTDWGNRRSAWLEAIPLEPAADPFAAGGSASLDRSGGPSTSGSGGGEHQGSAPSTSMSVAPGDSAAEAVSFVWGE